MGELFREGKSIRKAFASKGDDATFTRFVRVAPSSAPAKAPPPARGKGEALASPAARAGRTVHASKVVRVADAKSLLVSGHNNVKLGRDVRAGRMFQGYWIYSLSLEERATCPLSCAHWFDCYGNNMPLGKRVDHRDLIGLMERLEAEIADLVKPRPRHLRKGILIRLHALGDFFSPTYVRFWAMMLERHDRLAVFGYTARRKGEPIGDAIEEVRRAHPDRFRVRWSDGGEDKDCTVSIGGTDDCPANAFVCPEQTGQREACGKCGACWNSDTNVAFVSH